RLNDQIVGQIFQPRSIPNIWFTHRFDNSACNCAWKNVELVEIGFEKAPLCLRIVSKGLAAIVCHTCSFALILRNILNSSQIKAEIVAVWSDLNMTVSCL